MNYVWAILGFGLLIIVHELGHFTLAKLNGVKVVEFSIGMGPKIFSHQGKETKYTLALLPIGGFVNMLGEEEEVAAEGSFSSKSPLRRISIIVAGALMNFLLAIVIFTAFFCNFGFKSTELSAIVPDGAIAEVGLLPGDKIVKIDGSKVFTFDDISVGTTLAKGNEMTLTYKRDGEVNEAKIKPQFIEDENRYAIGGYFTPVENPTIMQGFTQSFKQTGTLISQTFKSFKMIFTGEANLKTDVGGPVTIIKMSAGAAKMGAWNLLYLVAFLSVSIAIFNLLPFPALDGGWTVILLIELITRRKVPDKVVGVLNTVGFMLLIGLMVLVTIKDIIFPMSF
ncbi:M50 family metallopeptidase [Clostridium paraputrificum]|uniref:M50 family metallopeptidase n=1 Tax=Clostridium TaxID=1485 RepID=UPI003D32CF1A